MGKVYAAVQGDTFESVARKVYGTDQGTQLIRQANPGVREPFAAGLELRIPDRAGDPKNRPQNAPAQDVDEIAVVIEAERFRFWHTIDIIRTLDSISTVEFVAPFEPDSQQFRDKFRPFSYKDITILADGEQLFAGTMVAVRPQVQESERTVAVSCYSRAGVLMDCTPPASQFPLEYNDLTLREIALNLLGPFGLELQFDADEGARFERVGISAGRRIWGFLSDLVGQRKAIMSSTSDGGVLIDTPSTGGQPVGVFSQGDPGPITSVQPFFSEQEYFSDITGLEPVIIGAEGSAHTVKNPRLTGVTRPFTFTAQDTEAGNLPQAVETKAGRMFGNMVSYKIQVGTWRDPNGNLWQPNTTLKLEWPDAMIYNETEFLIRDVVLSATDSRRSATLTIVLIGSFSGQIPEALPWQ